MKWKETRELIQLKRKRRKKDHILFHPFQDYEEGMNDEWMKEGNVMKELNGSTLLSSFAHSSPSKFLQLNLSSCFVLWFLSFHSLCPFHASLYSIVKGQRRMKERKAQNHEKKCVEFVSFGSIKFMLLFHYIII